MEKGSIYFMFWIDMSLNLIAGAWKRVAGGGIVSLGLLQMTRFRPVYRYEHIVATVTLVGLIPFMLLVPRRVEAFRQGISNEILFLFVQNVI